MKNHGQALLLSLVLALGGLTGTAVAQDAPARGPGAPATPVRASNPWEAAAAGLDATDASGRHGQSPATTPGSSTAAPDAQLEADLAKHIEALTAEVKKLREDYDKLVQKDADKRKQAAANAPTTVSPKKPGMTGTVDHVKDRMEGKGASTGTGAPGTDDAGKAGTGQTAPGSGPAGNANKQEMPWWGKLLSAILDGVDKGLQQLIEAKFGQAHDLASHASSDLGGKYPAHRDYIDGQISTAVDNAWNGRSGGGSRTTMPVGRAPATTPVRGAPAPLPRTENGVPFANMPLGSDASGTLDGGD